MSVDSPARSDERKVVTVLFADLVGSTALADEVDPERTRGLLERFYALTSAELETAGGTIEKFAGDAVMAVFGSPVAQEDHAQRALDAALRIRDEVVRRFEGRLGVRLGINSGEVLVAGARAGSAFVSGDAVNVAARLEQAAAPGQILVGARTAANARAAFTFGPVVQLEVKGKHEPVAAQELLGAEARDASRAPGALGTTFVGRELELDQMRAIWERVAANGEPHLVTLIGEPGIGKTSVLRRMLGWLGEQPASPIVRSGRCLAYGQGSTYWPLAQVLHEHLGIARTATDQEVIERLGDRRILGLTFGLPVADDLHPLAARERHHDAWIALLNEVAAQSTVVVVIEDLHWADEPLLDLLGELVREVRGPLLLLTTARPEFIEGRGNWSARRRVSNLWLDPLSSSDAGSMVSQLLGEASSAPFAALVVERAEGNPFFVEELLATLIDRGILRRADGRWRLLGGVEEIAMPDSIRAVIAARIDLLGSVEKATLLAAAVAGRTFSSTAVVDLLSGAAPDFGLLEERGFVRRFSHASAGEREYTFKHALTRDVAYASIPKRQRARLHAAFAEHLQRIGETGDQFAFLLAHHYFEAARPEEADLAWSDDPDRLAHLTKQAIAWLQRAGELATGRFAIDDGLSLLQRTLTLDPPSEIQAAIWRSIGRAHALRYAGVEALAAYESAVQATRDPALQAEIYAELALEVAQRWAMLNPMPSRALVSQWLDRALASAPPAGSARAKALAARALWSPNPADASAAVAIAESLGEPDLESHAYNASAAASFWARRYDESIEWAERRLALLDRISDPDHRVDILSGPIAGLLGQGRFDEARHYADLHDEAASKLSTHHQVHAVAMKLEIEELTARWDRMNALEPRARAVVEANVATPCVRNARSLLACSLADAVTGQTERSRELEERSVALEMRGYRASFASLRIRLAFARGHLGLLAALVGEAVPPPPAKNWWALNTLSARLDALAALRDRGAVEAEAPALAVEGTYLQPFALRALGVVRNDQGLLELAADRFEAMSLSWHAQETDTILRGASSA